VAIGDGGGGGGGGGGDRATTLPLYAGPPRLSGAVTTDMAMTMPVIYGAQRSDRAANDSTIL